MTNRRQLPSTLRDLLREVVLQKCPDLLSALELDPLSIPKKDRQRITKALGVEFCATGLHPDSEPNSRGLQLEELIDYIWVRPLKNEPEEPSS